MLDAMRKGATTWIAQILIIILAISFALWGVSGIFGPSDQATVAMVGDIKLTQVDYQRAAQSEERRLQTQLKQQLTRDQIRAVARAYYGVNFEELVMSKLIADAALDSHANALGVGVSEKSVLSLIAENKEFQDSSGQFSRLVFERKIANQGMNPNRFIADQYNVAIRSQLAHAVVRSVSVPDLLLTASGKYFNSTRTVEYIVIDEKSAGKIPDPDDAVLKEFYEKHKTAFMAPEYRKLSVLVAEPEGVKKDIKVPDQDVRDYYDNNKTLYVVPEKRTVEQIVFKDKKAAEDGVAKLKSGKKFEDLVKELELSDEEISLGTLAKTEFVDEKVAEAAFAMKKGETSGLVEGQFTHVVIRVKDVKPGLTRTLDEVKKTITDNLLKEKVADKIADLYEKIEEERDGGATLQEIGGKYKLTYHDIEAVDIQGEGPDGKNVEALKAFSTIVSEAFKSDVGVENDVVELFDGAYGWFDVVDVKPTRQRTFAEVRDKVKERWHLEELRKKLNELAKSYVERGEKGESLADIAKAAGVKVEKALTFRRKDNKDGFPSSAVSLAFAKKLDGFGSATRDGGKEKVIFKVTKISPAEALKDDQRKSYQSLLEGSIGNDLLAQYIEALQDRYQVTVNQDNVARLAGR